MKFEDSSQNLRGRLWIVQILVILLLGILGVRLYYLQLVRGAHYAEIAQNQRIRLLPIPAPRGVIFDREGRPLVTSRPIYNVILSREDLKGRPLQPLQEPLFFARALIKKILKNLLTKFITHPPLKSFLVKQNEP